MKYALSFCSISMMGFALSIACIRLPIPPPRAPRPLDFMAASMVSFCMRFSKASASFLKEGFLADSAC